MTPDDLRREDGSIDARVTVGGARHHKRTEASPEQCATWREQAQNGMSARQISRHTNFRGDTIGKHLRGDCNHDTDLELAYVRARKEWVPVDAIRGD